MYLGIPDTRAAVAFLKQEYGSYYGHTLTYQDGSIGTVIYTAKDIEFRRYSPQRLRTHPLEQGRRPAEGACVQPGLLYARGKGTLGRHGTGVPTARGTAAPAVAPCGLSAPAPHRAADFGYAGGRTNNPHAGPHPRAALPAAVSPRDSAPRGRGGLLGGPWLSSSRTTRRKRCGPATSACGSERTCISTQPGTGPPSVSGASRTSFMCGRGIISLPPPRPS